MFNNNVLYYGYCFGNKIINNNNKNIVKFELYNYLVFIIF